MALIKSRTLDTGVAAEYWRILQINNNFDRQDGVIDIVAYLDETARLAGASPMRSFQHSLGKAFSERLFDGSDKVKNVELSQAYVEFKKQAQDESTKSEVERNADLAWFADAKDDIP